MKEEQETGGGMLSKISQAKRESLSGMRPKKLTVKLGKVRLTLFFQVAL